MPINPSKAPNTNTIISTIEKLFRAAIMYSYWPNKSSNEEPDIPGSSIAHIAINPEINSTGSECDIWNGLSPTKIYASMANTTVKAIVFIFISSS